MDYIRNRFKIDSESLNQSCFFILDINDNEKIINDDIEMLNSNPSNEFLQMDLRQRDDVLSLCYDVTSKVSLSKLINKEIKKENFISLVLSIIKAISQCENYLISGTNMALIEDYIYVNLSTYEASLIYVPVENPLYDNVNDEFREFLKRLLDTKLVLDDNNLFVELMKKLRNDSLLISDIENFLKKYDSNSSVEADNINISYERNQMIQEEVKAPRNRKPQVTQQVKEPQRKSIEKKPENRPQVNNLDKNKKKNKVNSKSEQSKPKSKNKKGAKILIGASVLIIVIGIAIAVLSGSGSGGQAGGSGDTGKFLLAGLVVIGAVGGIYLSKKSEKNSKEKKSSKGNKEPRKEKKKENKKEKKNKSKASKEIKQMEETYSHREEVIQNTSSRNVVEDYPTVNHYDNQQSMNTEYLGEYDDSTVVLGMEAPKAKKTVLMPVKKLQKDEITINKNNFIVGRLSTMVDGLISSKAVSKMHAEIIKKNEEYFIKDLNAKNGTFVNGVRIKNEVEHNLKDGDIIKFANVEYIFTFIE